MTEEIERASARLAEACSALSKKPRLTTPEASTYLRDVHGLKVSASTLNKARSIGGGPTFLTFGRMVLYESSALDTWVSAKLSAPRRSTSDSGEAA
jgi:hypothetical protein